MKARRIARIAAVVGLSAALVVPGHAASAGASKAKAKKNPYKCGGKWDASATCTFKYGGAGLSYGGSFNADQYGFVTIKLEAEGPNGTRIPIISCGSAGTTFGTCGGVSTDSPTIDLEKGQTLFCTVTGAERGKYSCASFTK